MKTHSPLNFSGCLILKEVLRLKGKPAHTVEWGNQTDKINTWYELLGTHESAAVSSWWWKTNLKFVSDYHDIRESWKQFNWDLMILIKADRAQAESGILEKVQELAVLWTQQGNMKSVNKGHWGDGTNWPYVAKSS